MTLLWLTLLNPLVKSDYPTEEYTVKWGGTRQDQGRAGPCEETPRHSSVEETAGDLDSGYRDLLNHWTVHGHLYCKDLPSLPQIGRSVSVTGHHRTVYHLSTVHKQLTDGVSTVGRCVGPSPPLYTSLRPGGRRWWDQKPYHGSPWMTRIEWDH